MRNQAQAAGLNDVVVVNTCAVTAEAEKQARQEIRKIRRWKPDARIIATGCAVQIDPDSWASLPEIDGIIGNQDKLKSCLLYTSPSPRDGLLSRMPSSA